MPDERQAMNTPPHAKLIDPLRAPTPRSDTAAFDVPGPLGYKISVLPRSFGRQLETELDASLRALEEKNELLLVAETALHIFIEARKHGGYGMADAEEAARTALARIRAAKKET